jgi:hypothetical protein
VRLLEDALSKDLGVTQTVRRTTKIAALVQPGLAPDPDEHERIVTAAARSLTAWGTAPTPRPWTPPAPSILLRSTRDLSQRAIYPHDLHEGTPGFHIESCLGTSALVRLRDHDDPVHYVVDLNALKGRAVVLGDFTSPPTTTQPALF